MSGAATGESLYPVSHGQRALFFLHRLTPAASAAYTIAAAGTVCAPFDREALRRAFHTLVERHDALRTVFPFDGAEPVQRVAEAGAEAAAWFEEIDGSRWPAGEALDRLAGIAFRPFDLERGPLFRVAFVDLPRRPEGGEAASAPGAGPEGEAGTETVVVLSMHHIVGDLWSLALLMKELGGAYAAHRAGRRPTAELGLPPRGYGEWAARRRTALAGAEGERLARFWEERLSGGVPPLDLPTDRPRPPVQSFVGAVVSQPLGEGLRRALGAVARRQGTSLYVALVAAYQVLLSRWSGQTEFAVGSPTSGRTAAGSELARRVGYFVNPVPLRARLAGDPTFAQLLTAVAEEAAGALEHQDYPFALLAERLDPHRDASRPALFQALLVLQKSPVPGMRGLGAFALGREGAPLDLGELTLSSVALPQRGSQFDLSLFVTEEARELVGSLEYDGALFEAATARRMLGAFATLLAAAAADPDRPIAGLPLLAAEERRQILEVWGVGGRPDAPPEPRAPLHALFRLQAARAPEVEALVVGAERLDYGELARRSSVVARRLRDLGVGPETRVGIFLRRTAELPVALLGVLAAGGAYVPLDPEYPQERIAMVVADSGIELVLTEAGLAERLPPGAVRPLVVSEILAAGVDGAGEEPSPASVRAENLAYVIYTSGSTGRPKGVAISHAAAGALLAWAARAYAPDELAGVLASTSISFDLSVFELFVPLTRGGRVILADNALALPDLPAAGEVTLVNTVPSAMGELAAGGRLPASVRTVNLAGEPLRKSLVDAVYRAGAVRRVVNLYGPSEDTTYSTIAECPRDAAGEPTIGRPIAGGRAYVVDRALEPQPPGVPGELLLGGAGLARGYLGRPALTAGRWLPDPFSGEVGGRLYRTGDLARWRGGGELEFLGRLDHQVKVRGFRIELGEIETALVAQERVGEAVAVVHGDGAERRIVAYLVAAAPAAPADAAGAADGNLPGVGELREALAARLPAYMIPAVFIELPALPSTPNGKIDRKALPDPGGERPALERDYIAPETEVERMLAAIWAAALGVEQIGIHDSFFELGGHSLTASQVLLQVREAFGIDLPVHRLFERPTIAGLSQAIAEELVAGADAATVAEILGEGSQDLSP